MSDKAEHKCDEGYPQYGVAPHECFWRKPGGFAENTIGQSTIEPLEEWPDNFLAEIDPTQRIGPQISYGLCGVWYCPVCKKGMEETDTLWSKEKIESRLAAARGEE